MRNAIAAALLVSASPLPDCIADRIHSEETPASSAPKAKPKPEAPATAQTVAVGPTPTSKPAPPLQPTTPQKRGVATTTAPPPATPPPPAPSPSPSPSPGRHVEFSAGNGRYGGLYPRQAEFIAVSQANATQFHKCFAGITDAWSVLISVTVPPKGGPLSFPMNINHEGTPDTSPQGKAILECHANIVKTWPWPASGGIEGLDGGNGYLNIVSGMIWRAN